jgi:hypothetical protein
MQMKGIMFCLIEYCEKHVPQFEAPEIAMSDVTKYSPHTGPFH